MIILLDSNSFILHRLLNSFVTRIKEQETEKKIVPLMQILAIKPNPNKNEAEIAKIIIKIIQSVIGIINVLVKNKRFRLKVTPYIIQ